MARLCENTPLPIALDEELIGIFSTQEKQEVLKMVKPQFIILTKFGWWFWWDY